MNDVQLSLAEPKFSGHGSIPVLPIREYYNLSFHLLYHKINQSQSSVFILGGIKRALETVKTASTHMINLKGISVKWIQHGGEALNCPFGSITFFIFGDRRCCCVLIAL